MKYNKEAIRVLSDIDHIKIRSGMYIGDGKDPSQLFNETFDNAIDEIMTGFSDKLTVNVDSKENQYSIRDYGRGIPHGKKDLNGEMVEVVEILCTKSNSGGKFDNDSYKISGGLHGLGLTITNALSESLNIKSFRDKKSVELLSKDGVIQDILYNSHKGKNGTEISFIPSRDVFGSHIIPTDFIVNRCKTASALGYQTELVVDKEEINVEADMFDLIPKDEEELTTYAQFEKIRVDSTDGEFMQVALRYTSETNSRHFGYTNMLYNSIGGVHVNELNKALIECWKKFISDKKIKLEVELRNNDFLIGVRTVCAVFISKPEFSSQTKDKLTVDKSYFSDLMLTFQVEMRNVLDSNKDISMSLIKRFEEYRMSQNKLLARKEISSMIKINEDSPDSIRRRSVVPKLIECTQKSRVGTELYILEGDSACFTGDTEVTLLNGSVKTFEQMVNEGIKECWIYSSENMNFKPMLGRNPRVTKYVNGIIELKMSDGSIVRCTHEHEYINRDTGKWIRADELKIGQSLFSIKRRINAKGYEEYYDNDQCKWISVHKNVANNVLSKQLKGLRYDYRDKYPVVHHKDGKLNNDPDFLEWMGHYSHFIYHSRFATKTITKYNKSDKARKTTIAMNKTQEHRDKLIKAHKDGKYKNATFNTNGYNSSQKHHDDLIKRANTVEHKEKFNEMVVKSNQNKEHNLTRVRSRITKVIKRCIELNLDITRENYTMVKLTEFNPKCGIPTYENILKSFDSYNQAIEYSINYNLSVVNITYYNYDKPTPVYCMTVDGSENFMLSNGLIAHNCGPAARARNKVIQAVLPLRGKIKNVTNMSPKEAIKSQEICNIVNAIGCGIGSQCDSSKSRYDKIIINSDADEDGKNIVCLVLSAFVNMLPDIVKDGRLYIVEPPLYGWQDKVGYHYSNDRNEIPSNTKFTRYKGLGEMDDDEYKFCCMSPDSRQLTQVEYPSDIEHFNFLLGTSEGKASLLKDIGITNDLRVE